MAEMSSVFEVGFLSFSDEDSAAALAEQLRAGGATHKVNDVSVLEHRRRAGSRSTRTPTSAPKERASPVGRSWVRSWEPSCWDCSDCSQDSVGGAAVGATIPGRNPHDLELNDEFVGELRASLPPGSSGLLIVGEPEPVEELMGSVHASGVVVAKAIRHPLTEAQAAAIKAAIIERQKNA